MKTLLIVAFAARAGAADPLPPDRTPSLTGPPSIGVVMEPPRVDQVMVIVPPAVDAAIVIGPRDIFGRLADALVGAVHWLVPATL